jgi:hypothetical protein
MTSRKRVGLRTCEYAEPQQQAGQRLTTVTPPVGPGWTFAYVNGNGLDGAGLRSRRPPGGVVTYDFDDQILPAYEGTHRSVLARRITGGRGGSAGTWNFTYVQPPARPTERSPCRTAARSSSKHAWSPFGRQVGPHKTRCCARPEPARKSPISTATTSTCRSCQFSLCGRAPRSAAKRSPRTGRPTARRSSTAARISGTTTSRGGSRRTAS